MESSPIRRGGQYGLQTSTEGGRVWGADEYGGQSSKEGRLLRREVH
jgi:hypothetical protein